MGEAASKSWVAEKAGCRKRQLPQKWGISGSKVTAQVQDRERPKNTGRNERKPSE